MKSIKSKLLISIGLVVLVFSVILLYRSYHQSTANATGLINQQLALALDFNLSIQEYVADSIRPISRKLAAKDRFIPQIMSTSFIARSVFENVRKKHPDYIFKLASANPRNPINQAGPEELEMIRYFNNHPGQAVWTGEIIINGSPYYAKFSARRMEEACLGCHGDPADAPADLIEKYGSKASFHLEVGKVVGLDTVAIPSEKLQASLWDRAFFDISLIGMGIIFLCISLYFILNSLVINRISKLSDHFRDCWTPGKLPLQIKPLQNGGHDELHILTDCFNQLAKKYNESYLSLKAEIDERKEAQASLQESETRYRDMFDNSPISIWEEDFSQVKLFLGKLARDGINDLGAYFDEHPEQIKQCASLVKITAVNQKTLDMFKATSKSQLLRHLGLVITSESVKTFRDELVAMNEGNSFFSAETTNRTLSGEKIHVSLQLHIPPESTQTWDRVLVSLEDVSERRTSEEKIRFFKFIVENMSDAAYWVMEDGRFLYANRAACDATGYSRGELLQMGVYDIDTQMSKDKWRQHWLEMKEKGSSVFEVRHRRKNGEVFPVEISANFIDYQGLQYLFSFARDITDRKEAEKALIASESRLRSLIQAAPSVIIVLSPEHEILEFNPAAEELYGCARNEVLGKNYLKTFLPSQAHEAAARDIRNVLAGTPTQGYENQVLARGGQAKTISWYLNRYLNPETFTEAVICIGLDVTGRKDAENALRDQMALSDKILHSSLNGLYVYDLETQNNVFINPAYTEITGYTLPELDGLSADEFAGLFHPDDLQAVLDHIKEVAQSSEGEAIEIEYRFKHAKGHWIWCYSRDAAFERNPDGSVKSMIGTFVDITSHKKTETQLKLKEKELSDQLAEVQHIYQTSPVGLALMDTDLRFVRINEALAEINGPPADEHIGKKLHQVLPELAPFLEPLYQGVIDSGEPVLNQEITGVTPREPATEKTWLINYYPVRGLDGAVMGVGTVVQEITELKAKETALKQSELRLAEAQRIAHVGWWDLNLINDEIICSPEVYRIFGLEPGKGGLSRSDINQIVHPDDLEAVRSAFEESLNHRTQYDVTHRVIRPDGEVRHVRQICETTYADNGEPVRSLGITHDLTEIRDAERMVRKLNIELEERVKERTQELKAVNQELESFAYSVSHDLRAPLRALDGFSLALLEDYETALDEQGRDYLTRIRLASQRMGKLIDDILQLSRITRKEFRPEQVDISSLSSEILAELRSIDPARTVRLDIQPGLQTQGDEALLHVLFTNLLSNAWKFTTQKNQARISVGRVQPEPDGEGRQQYDNVFFVRDNGVGFDMAYAKKLFQPFQRLHSEKDYPGSGIGLATVMRVINRHGGKIWAESADGKGATFYVAL